MIMFLLKHKISTNVSITDEDERDQMTIKLILR